MKVVSKLAACTVLLSLLLHPALLTASGPKTGKKAPKKEIIKVVASTQIRNVITLQSAQYLRNISFVITDSRGVIKMFGENYRSGSSINVGHLEHGNYTIFFGSDTNSAEGYFTVR